MRLIDGDALGNRLYHEVFEKDSEDQRWDSGCWMRYRLFEKVLREQPTIEQPEIIRCRECKFGKWDIGDRGMYCGRRYVELGTYEDFFCAAAERREVSK